MESVAANASGEARGIAGRLPDALLVLHQGDAHMALAVFAEACSRRYGNARLLDQQRGELDAAQRLKRFGDRRPGEHRSPRHRHMPSGAAERIDQRVAPAPIGRPHLLDAIVGPLERGGRRHLDRREGAIVEIRFHPRQRTKGILTACDNTFASPWTQRPLEYGFDLVMHSTTKYLNGHSDMVGGIVVVGENATLRERMAFLQNAVGAVQGPFNSFLALRGVKTLALRMERQSASARHIAERLAAHPRIARVYYPGLASHPHHDLARRQMRAFGAMIAVEVKGSGDDTRRFLERCRLFTLAESLGGVESLISLPALMTHASTPPQVRDALGISDRLVRISVGIEDTDDLIADLEAALG